MITQDWRHATPEQKNFWRIASALIAYDTITPLYYQGPLVASEFLVYAATKLYIALELESYASDNTIFDLFLYDIANVVCMRYPTYQLVGGGQFMSYQNNVYFSRVLNSAGTPLIKFNGYRLDVI